jgi:pyridoxal phosphate enzyme (YggS family)
VDGKTLSDVNIAERLEGVRARIASAQARAARAAEEVTLVAVSKLQPFSAIESAYAAGQRDFGENRLDELWEKVATAQDRGLDEIRWHMIGSIQSRKTPQVVGPFVLVHSVDRVKIANRLSRDAGNAGSVIDVLLEVNVSGEESKHGFSPADVLASANRLIELPNLRIHGLMTMAPIADDPEEVRPFFHELRLLRDELANRHPKMDWRELSMGMTQDFEVAVEEGATIVRVGSAIFGPRPGRD